MAHTKTTENNETPMIAELLDTSPHIPTTQGVVLLLYQEMKSEFRSVRSEIETLRRELREFQEILAKPKQDVATPPLTRSVDQMAADLNEMLLRLPHR